MGFWLQQQLGLEYIVAVDNALLPVSPDRYYRPDFAVIPLDLAEAMVPTPDSWETFAFALPLVGEVWSPSNSEQERQEKLQGYQERGDQEIWRIHPKDLVLRRWLRLADGSYVSQEHREGVISPHFLPHVTIHLDELWRRIRRL